MSMSLDYLSIDSFSLPVSLFCTFSRQPGKLLEIGKAWPFQLFPAGVVVIKTRYLIFFIIFLRSLPISPPPTSGSNHRHFLTQYLLTASLPGHTQQPPSYGQTKCHIRLDSCPIAASDWRHASRSVRMLHVIPDNVLRSFQSPSTRSPRPWLSLTSRVSSSHKHTTHCTSGTSFSYYIAHRETT